jgi:phage terminase large subunit GpA-like protein
VLILGRKELAERARKLASFEYCQDPIDIAERSLGRLLPRENIPTLSYSQQHRVIRKPDGTKAQWSLDLTPYLAPIMDAHDDPEVLEIIVPKPGRCGGTVVAENHALKMMEFGPTGDIMWYLAGPEEVRSYADRVLAPIFEDHEGVQRRIGGGKSDNNKTRKRLGGQTFELMVMSKKTTTNRQARYIVFDEPDSYHKDFRSGFLEQGRQRQRMLGNDRKIYACAHPDVGWSGGIAAAWSGSSQGIFVMQCPECQGHASPYPTKYWPEVARFKLHYVKSPENTPLSTRLAVAERTAGIMCPHCGSVLDEIQRAAMVEEGAYMHRGQEIDLKAGIIGTPDPNRTWGFWIHVLMSKQVGLGELARELEGALEHKERTGKTDKLRQVLVRTFGEAFEGAGDVEGLDARRLKKRTEELAKDAEPVGYRMGTVPDGVLFLTAAVDVGGNKFDLLVRGWDAERRSWLIDRRTIRQRRDGAVMRDLAPSKVQEDWSVLEAEIDRIYPLQRDPGKALPVAVMTIDASDGNVTWKAYEFARRMDRKRWKAWRKVRCIKGSTNTKADPLPPKATDISKDSEGKAVEPVVTLHVLGVHKLKEDTLQDLGIEDGSPGQCYFASDTPDRAFQELFNEPLIEGTFVRNGPNETLDLYAYTEAARLMLQPDRKDIRWDVPSTRPIWAQPVSLQPEGGDPLDDAGDEAPAPKVKAPPKRSMVDRLNALNSR